MKRTILSLLLAVFAAVLHAENRVTLTAAEGHPGDVVTVGVALQNADAVSAVEVKITLPEALRYVDGSCTLNATRSNGHQLSAAVVDGTLRVYIYSLGLQTLKGEEGELFRFQLKMGKEPTTYALQPAVVLSNAAGERLEAVATEGAVTLLSPKLEILTPTTDYGRVAIRSSYEQSIGLQNVGNEPLTVTDIETGNATLSMGETQFTIAPGEAKWVALTYSPVERGAFESLLTVMSNAVNGNRQTAKVVAAPYSVNELHVQQASGTSDETITVTLRMNNMEPIVAAQCEFVLPEALVYEEGSVAVTATRAANHKATASMRGNTLRLVAYSPNNTPFAAEDGELLTFRLRLNGSSGWYWLEPQNVVLSNRTIENMTSATSGEYVIIESPEYVAEERFSMGSSAVTQTAKGEYGISNNGQAPLVIERITFLAEGFAVTTPLPLTIAPGETAAIGVSYTPDKEGHYGTTMQVYTNDPMRRMVSVEVSGTTYEPNALTLKAAKGANGQKLLDFALENYSQVTALQLDVHAAFASEMTEENLLKSERLKAHSLVMRKVGEGRYRILVYSMGNDKIPGNSGTLFSLVLDGGTKTMDVKVDNIVISNLGEENKNSGAEINYRIAFVTVAADGGEHGSTTGCGDYLNGETVTITAQPHNEAEYIFKAWSNGRTENPLTFTATADESLTAQFVPKQYTLSYVVDGEEYKRVEVRYGEAVPEEAAPEKEGHTFSGWSETPATMPAKDVTITGSFSVNTYKVRYMLDEAEYKVVEVIYGATIPEEVAPEKEGHTFSGWSEAPATMPAKDITISGSFTANTYTVIYIVDGEEYKRASVIYGEAVPAEAAPVKEGHTFSGWGETPATMPAKDITINGSFTANIYKATYMVDGAEYKVVEVRYGEAIPAEAAPEKEGHTFSGWSEVPETMPANDITITGTFTANTYTVIYMVDGEEYKRVSVIYGEAIPAENEPTKEGHTFSGWSEAPATMPAKDITINGSFTANTYTVIYIVDGEEYKRVEVRYGEAIPTEPDPEKEGYIFSGWSEVPETMPAEDVTVNGSFTSVGIDGITAGSKVDVYNLSGIKVAEDITLDELKSRYEKGIYIINGRKYRVD